MVCCVGDLAQGSRRLLLNPLSIPAPHAASSAARQRPEVHTYLSAFLPFVAIEAWRPTASSTREWATTDAIQFAWAGGAQLAFVARPSTRKAVWALLVQAECAFTLASPKPPVACRKALAAAPATALLAIAHHLLACWSSAEGYRAAVTTGGCAARHPPTFYAARPRPPPPLPILCAHVLQRALL